MVQTIAEAGGLEVAFGDTSAANLVPLLIAERAELEAVFGVPVTFGRPGSASLPRWICRTDPTIRYARLEWSAGTRELIGTVRGPQDAGVMVNLLFPLVAGGSVAVDDAPCADEVAAFDRIRDTVAAVYPSFGLRDLDWDAVTARYEFARDLRGPDFLRVACEWVAELGDAHTQLITEPTVHHPPYRAVMTDDGVVFTEVPPWSAAAGVGVRAGWRIPVDDPDAWRRAHGAGPRHHAAVVARRFLALADPQRNLVAVSPAGRQVGWTERAVAHDPVEVDDATVRLRSIPADLPSRIGEVLRALPSREDLTLDLRGNTGGNLLAAYELRDRFLRERTFLGTVQYSTGRGWLAAPIDRYAEPSREALPRHLRVLTDEMTYSAAEDFLLGLQGLSHVVVRGTATGGGSGRPLLRTVLPGVHLRVSTALTADRTGRVVELHGIPADESVRTAGSVSGSRGREPRR